MSHEAQILVFSDFPAEGERIAQTIRGISDRPVRTATDPVTALEILGTHPPEIVFAHLQAGPVAATCFLNEVWTRHPQATRFLLGNSVPDSDALVRCALGPHQFIPGPVDPPKLDAALSRADSIKHFVRNEKIRQLVSRMRTLPSRPALSIEIMRELRSTHASASVVGEMISRDVAISTKLIQIANSAFYRGDQQVSNPFDAVLLIGLETTAALVLSIETFAQLDKLKPLYFSMDRVWKHSQSVAERAKKISQAMGGDAETNANVFTAGLLHDIGKIALALNFEEDYEKLPKDAEKKGLSLHQAEEQFFGASHAETGAYLLAVWGLPLPIVEAVAGHHRSADKLSQEFPAITALHLADRLVNVSENLTLEHLEEILAEYPAELGLSPRLKQFKSTLGISKSRPAKQPKPNPAPTTNKSPATSPPTPAPQSRRGFYLAFTASIALISVIAFYSWPQIVPLLNPQAKLRAETSQESKAAKSIAPAPDADHEATLQPVHSLPLDQATLPDQPFPFDHLFPVEESSLPEHRPVPDQEETPDTLQTPAADSTGRLTSNVTE